MGVEHDSRSRVRFSGFEMDLETAELFQDGRRVDLAPQPSKLLATLVARPGRLIDRQTLRREIWGDRWQDWEAGLHQAVRRIRVVLGDAARAPRFVETVPRRGYRFIGALEGVAAAPARSPVARARRGGIVAAALVAAIAAGLTMLPWIRSSTTAADPMEPPIEARRLVSEARHFLGKGDVEKALDRLTKASDRAPDWAEPWSTLAEVELARPGGGRVERARIALEHALARDAEDARSWLILARLRLWQAWDWPGARHALDRAAALRVDDPDVWQLVAALETVTGRMEEAVDAARRAMALDPVSTAVRADLGWTLYYAGDAQAGLDECRRALDLEPSSPSAVQCAVQAAWVLGRNDVVHGLLADRLPPLEDGPILGTETLDRYARAQIAAVEQGPSCDEPAATAVPRMLAGDVEGALDALARGAEARRGWAVPFAVIDPLFGPWRDDPRFAAAVEALGTVATVLGRQTEPAADGTAVGSAQLDAVAASKLDLVLAAE